MKVIHKYQLKLTVSQTISIPADHEILDVQYQNGEICLWALVDTNMPERDYSFYLFGTGDYAIDKYCSLNHLKTLQNSGFVWHIFTD